MLAATWDSTLIILLPGMSRAIEIKDARNAMFVLAERWPVTYGRPFSAPSPSALAQPKENALQRGLDWLSLPQLVRPKWLLLNKTIISGESVIGASSRLPAGRCLPLPSAQTQRPDVPHALPIHSSVKPSMGAYFWANAREPGQHTLAMSALARPSFVAFGSLPRQKRSSPWNRAF
ncbi:hypothetical protein N185_34255 [Sinorhizobium sp. GW3]|nr:hypothetical protein N185_34255 [Sinorhizobium sp. GW3]